MTPSVGAVVTLVRLEGVVSAELKQRLGQSGVVRAVVPADRPRRVRYGTAHVDVLVEFEDPSLPRRMDSWWCRASELEVVE